MGLFPQFNYRNNKETILAIESIRTITEETNRLLALWGAWKKRDT